MHFKFNNYWHQFDLNLIGESGFVTFFEIVWQFDNYYKGVQFILLNFELQIYWS